MIPNHWYPLLESAKVKRAPVAVRRMGEALVLWRDADGGLVCMRDSCPHRHAALSRGKVVGGQLECPYHGFRFEASGSCVLMPCEGRDAKIPTGMRAATCTVREQHGLIWLFWGDAAGVLPEIPWFDQARDDRPGASRSSFSWPINYVRSVESNFDMHHTPFVHGRSLPGLGTRLDPYTVAVDGTHIVTSGQIRKEGAAQGIAFRVEFKAPSITYLEFGKLSFLVADCPIDDDATWRHAVYYQDYVTIPGLHRFGSWLSLLFDWKLFQVRQDLRIAETLTPKFPAEHFDRLVHADAGTAAYRALRRKLLAAADDSGDSADSSLRRVS